MPHGKNHWKEINCWATIWGNMVRMYYKGFCVGGPKGKLYYICHIAPGTDTFAVLHILWYSTVRY